MKTTDMTSGDPPRQIEVLDAGSAPRRVLVYAPAPGTSEIVEVTTDSPRAGPRTIETVDVEIVDVEDGWISARMKIIAAYAEPRPTEWRTAEESTAKVTKIVGSKLAITTNVFGEVGEAVLTSTKVADSIIRWRDLRFHWTVPLPRVPLGQGARWTKTREEGGIRQVETTTITKLDGDRVSITSTTAHTVISDGSASPVHINGEWEIRLDRLCASGIETVSSDGKPEETAVFEYHVQ